MLSGKSAAATLIYLFLGLKGARTTTFGLKLKLLCYCFKAPKKLLTIFVYINLISKKNHQDHEGDRE